MNSAHTQPISLRNTEEISMSNTDDLQYILDNSEKIAFYTGKEVSILSGLIDFRSKDNLYKKKYRHSPPRILTEEYFDLHPDEFYEFIRDRVIFDESVTYNYIHEFIGKYQKINKVKGVISQNTDGLLSQAGVEDVVEIYGSIQSFHCLSCRKKYSLEQIRNMKSLIPYCSCYGYIRPDIILYDEELKEENIIKAINILSESDTLVVIGTSLKDLINSGLYDYYKGDRIIVVSNYTDISNDSADLCISAPIVDTLKEIIIR